MLKYSVLIADDDKFQREVERILLGEIGKGMDAEITIEEASDSVETAQLVERQTYDLIILDNEFKDQSTHGHLPGIAILQKMRKMGPNRSSPTVFCSGDPYDTLKDMAEKHGAIYCSKTSMNVGYMTRLFSSLLLK